MVVSSSSTVSAYVIPGETVQSYVGLAVLLGLVAVGFCLRKHCKGKGKSASVTTADNTGVAEVSLAVQATPMQTAAASPCAREAESKEAVTVTA